MIYQMDGGSPAIWSSLPEAAAREAASAQILDEGLVACASIFGLMRSLFIWRGERGEAEVAGVLFKTDAALRERAFARLEQLHYCASPTILERRCHAPVPATGSKLRSTAC